MNTWVIGFRNEEALFPPLDVESYSMAGNKLTVLFTKDQSCLINSNGWEIYRKNLSSSGDLSIFIYTWENDENIYVDCFESEVRHTWWSTTNKIKSIIYTYTARMRKQLDDTSELEFRSRFREIAAQHADERVYSSNLVDDIII